MSISEHSVSLWRSRLRTTVVDYLTLTKPRTLHLVVGVVPAMLLADRGVVAPMRILNVVIGAVLITAGANTLNCVGDADIDKLMKRTAGRPLARSAISTRRALLYGTTLNAAGFLWLQHTTNLLAGALAEATIVFYVLVYTLLIKRRTTQNVVWGGVANGMPMMIGWSAVTGAVGWQAWVMLGIVFFWTPPHSWALAMMRKADYRSAGVPMLPTMASERHVANRILVYTWLTAMASVALATATGWLYAAVALVAAVWVVAMAHRLQARARRGELINAGRLFQRANIYLTAVFCALAVDSVLALPTTLNSTG